METAGTKYIQTVVSSETHKQLKILAMEEGKTLQKLLREHLEVVTSTQPKKEVLPNG